MRTLCVIELILVVSIIAPFGIAAAESLFLVHSASAATDVVTGILGEVSLNTMSRSNTTTTNNNSNALLGNLFLVGDDKLTSFNPINETYTEVSYVGNRTIMPPNANGTTILATETGNLRLNSNQMILLLLKGKAYL